MVMQRAVRINHRSTGYNFFIETINNTPSITSPRASTVISKHSSFRIEKQRSVLRFSIS